MKKILILSLIIVSLTSCGSINKSLTTQIYTDVDRKNVLEDEVNDSRREIISSRIKKMKYIKDVSVVITEGYAVIGIELMEELTEREIILLKNQIKTLTKNLDENIDHVSITTTPTLIKKINESDTTNEEKKLDLPEELEETIIELTPQL